MTQSSVTIVKNGTTKLLTFEGTDHNTDVRLSNTKSHQHTIHQYMLIPIPCVTYTVANQLRAPANMKHINDKHLVSNATVLLYNVITDSTK